MASPTPPVPPASRSDEAVVCPHGQECGGCALLELSRAAQLEAKASRLSRAVGRYASLADVPRAPVVAAPTATGYRRRVKYVSDDLGRLGLFARGTKRVVDLPECVVLEPMLLEVTRGLRRVLAPHRGEVLGVDVRLVGPPDGPAALVTWNLRGHGAAEHGVTSTAPLVRATAALPHVAGVAVRVVADGGRRILEGTPSVEVGAAALRETSTPSGRWTSVTHGGFVQAHGAQALAVVDRVASALEAALGGLGGRHVVELFAGSGAHALELASRGALATAVEVFAPAALALGEAARAQGLGERVRVEAQDADAALIALGRGARSLDAVVVNPPRRGVAPALRASVAALRPAAIAYVSCEPETLARDLAAWHELGYRAEVLEPYDMIPLSAEVETVALLRPAPPPGARVLYAERALLAVDKPPHLPTTPHLERRGSLVERVRALDGWADAVPIHRLDAGTSGVCLFARTPADVEPLADALARGTKRYRALVRGISRDHGVVRRALREAGRSLPAVTRYRRREVVGQHSLVDVEPETGRTHQIRRHLASLGHPLVGDDRHGDPATNRYFFHRHGLDRTFLHCACIELTLPGASAPRVLEAPLPGDLAAVLASLGASPSPHP